MNDYHVQANIEVHIPTHNVRVYVYCCVVNDQAYFLIERLTFTPVIELQ